MGFVIRRLLGVLLLLACQSILWPAQVYGFSGFGATSADATYGKQMVFRVDLQGGPPQQLEILLRFSGSDSTFVAPVTAVGDTATYRWDTAADYVTPNTRVDYEWRATTASGKVVSPAKTLLYDDDRPGLVWHTVTTGDATLHWVGSAESQARHFGDLTAAAASRAEGWLGHRLDGPVDIFVYQTQAQFFGALGPGAREWTGAAAYPQLRTVFMYLQGNDQAYLDTVVTHEVTHVVFHDATANPFHEPARWLNEGLATWAEQQSAQQQESLVRSDASQGLLAFDAIGQQFPIDRDQALLSYAEGATMVQMIISQDGVAALARLAAAYRDGATDAAALQSATGETAQQLYATYFRSFGASQPQPIKPAPLLASNVRKPPAGSPAAGSQPGPSANHLPVDGLRNSAVPVGWLLLGGLALVVVAGLVVGWRVRRARGGDQR